MNEGHVIEQNDIASDITVNRMMQERSDECDYLRRLSAGWICYGVLASAIIAYLLVVRA